MLTTNEYVLNDENKSLKLENRTLKREILNLKEENELLKKLLLNKSPNLIETLPKYNEETDDETLLFLQRSEQRVTILKLLSQGAKIPTTIGKQLTIKVGHVSHYLKDLKEKELIQCLNEEDKRHRFYALTPKGKKYLDLVDEVID